MTARNSDLWKDGKPVTFGEIRWWFLSGLFMGIVIGACAVGIAWTLMS